MRLEEFRDTLAADHPPRGIAAPLRALWHDGRGDWKGAHEIVQAERSKDAERVHAYLHRKEGDLANADYWYADKFVPGCGPFYGETSASIGVYLRLIRASCFGTGCMHSWRPGGEM